MSALGLSIYLSVYKACPNIASKLNICNIKTLKNKSYDILKYTAPTQRLFLFFNQSLFTVFPLQIQRKNFFLTLPEVSILEARSPSF